MKSKSPIAAAIFNFILPGAGYLYLGIRKAFAWLLLAAELAFIGAYIADAAFRAASDGMMDHLIGGILTSLLFSIAFAVDAFKAAKSNSAQA